MKRSHELLIRRKRFVDNYFAENPKKSISEIMLELEEKLFISTTTIHNIRRSKIVDGKIIW
ncbi:hypothetical protein [Aureivirga marina]|uniref:hypothetical protein n=1 Tax=Aureivirga marina TaxID=1182451 RepID=UPI0018C90CDF|nr:hypothetical protein [Aureivirga marina]